MDMPLFHAIKIRLMVFADLAIHSPHHRAALLDAFLAAEGERSATGDAAEVIVKAMDFSANGLGRVDPFRVLFQLNNQSGRSLAHSYAFRAYHEAYGKMTKKEELKMRRSAPMALEKIEPEPVPERKEFLDKVAQAAVYQIADSLADSDLPRDRAQETIRQLRGKS